MLPHFVGLLTVSIALAETSISPLWVENVPQLFPRLPIAAPFSSDEQCKEDSLRLIAGLENGTDWAVSMWDASAQTAIGVRQAANIQLGDFDACFLVNGPVKTKFCAVLYFINITFGINDTNSVYPPIRDRRYLQNGIYSPRDSNFWGLCQPASCSPTDMTTSIKMHLDALSSSSKYPHISNEIANYSAFVLETSCQHQDFSQVWSGGEIAFWVFTAICLLISSFCTIFHEYGNPKKTFGVAGANFTKCWSMKANFESLLNVKERSLRYPFVGFNLVKVYCMFGVFLGHKIISLMWNSNQLYVREKKITNPKSSTMVMSDFGPDWFLFISGVYLAYYQLIIFKEQYINPFRIFMGRMIRLAPLYFYVIWFCTVAIYRMGSGPLWKFFVGSEVGYCEKNWWTNLIFISNYYNANEICLTTSWYVNVDVHCVIVGLIVLFICLRYEKIAILILTSLVIALSCPAMLMTYNEYVEVFFMFKYSFVMDPRNDPAFSGLYIKSHNRAPCFFFGMLFGYYLYKTKDKKDAVSWFYTLLYVAASLIISQVPLFVMVPEMLKGVTDDNKLLLAVLGHLRRILACLALALLLHAYRFRDLKFIKSITESRIIIFLSRLTYGFYLVHFNVIVITSARHRYPISVSWAYGILTGLSELIISFALALLLEVAIDAPIRHILNAAVFPSVQRKEDKGENNGIQLENGSRE